MNPMDSTGKPIQAGNRVRFRGQLYTIKSIALGLSPMLIDFVEERHMTEVPTEFSVDIVEPAS